MPRLRSSLSTQSSADMLAQAVQSWLENADPTTLFRTCLTCHHSEHGTAMCNKFKRVPPVQIITGSTACDHYMDNEDIPF